MKKIQIKIASKLIEFPFGIQNYENIKTIKNKNSIKIYVYEKKKKI